MSADAGALCGVCVLDLGRNLAAPYAGQMLGDFGAEVIKVERPGRGDDTRSYAPIFAAGDERKEIGYSADFLCGNRNKKSITVDLASPQGQEIISKLAAKSDVLIENYKVGDLKRYGLDYAKLSAVNPRLVYCSVTGYGQTGPYANRPGFDPMFQALSGLMSVTGTGTTLTGVNIMDVVAGYHATIGILTALMERARSGKGQYIDIALLDCGIASLTDMAQRYLVTRQTPTPTTSYLERRIAPTGQLKCGDGAIFLGAGRDHHFASLCAVLGRPELSEDPRFKGRPQRFENRVVLDETLESLARGWKGRDLVDALGKVGVPSAVINNLEGTFSDPQVRQRGLEVTVTGSQGEPLTLVANPVRLSRTPAQYKSAPPTLGDHTDEVLRDRLGMRDEEIAAARRAGTI